MTYNSVALAVPRILLPDPRVDLTRWAVVACDQYTSQPEYWRDVERFVGASPSTLRLILPEAFLGTEEEERFLASIRRTMDAYLEQGILQPLEEGFVLVERTTSHGSTRRGLVVSLDLERYDFSPGSTSLVRATEGTVMERLPVRVRIRSRASIELPHIMVLIDDPGMTVIEPLFRTNPRKIYDFDLMMRGGSLRGYHITERPILDSIASGLERLADPERCRKRYGSSGDDALLYAVGDGNHSLAAAKLFWEQVREASGADHPARYALVELVNLHDPGLTFEPIHRYLANVKPPLVLDAMSDFFTRHGCRVSFTDGPGAKPSTAPSGNAHVIGYRSGDDRGSIVIEDAPWTLEVGSIQAFLDDFCDATPDARTDYIHGTDTLEGLASSWGSMGFFLPVISKNRLFETIVREGVLPRKAFSMGHADEKRFYMECRKIVM